MIRLDNIHLTIGGQVLFNGVSWQLKDNDRVALVGSNGAGKTTFLKMIADEITPDRGEIVVPRNIYIGHFPQEIVFLKGNTVFQEVRSVFKDILNMQETLENMERLLAEENPSSTGYDKLLSDYGQLQEKFQVMEGYNIDVKVCEVLNGLGFVQSDMNRQVEEFSGGWQMRMVLAKLLLLRPEVLLLDEPTNHLDLEARNWLEDYLKSYPGSIVMVTHDRYFLDLVSARITEIENGNVTDYYSDYEEYLKEKQARYERLESQVKRQQDNIKKTQTFINRYRYDKRRASLVQSRIKMLEKIDVIQLPPRLKTIRFQFPDPPRSGRVVINLKNVVKSYGTLEVFKNLNIMVERGDRIGLVGPNGAGKSTLMRILAGTEKINSGTRELGHNVRLRFMDQQVAATLNLSNIVLDELQSVAPYDIVPQVRTLLGAFLFSGDDVNKRVSVLSGGEKSRLAIAKMLLEPSNLLLLDEPTNHLDIRSQEILLEALKNFSGTIIFVSHERYFINHLAKKIWEVDKGNLTVYPGNYEDYLAKKSSESILSSQVKTKVKPRKPKKNKNVKFTSAKPGRMNQRKIQLLLRDIEETIHRKESELNELAIILADPDLYKDGDNARQMVLKHKNLLEEINNLYDKWTNLDQDNSD